MAQPRWNIAGRTVLITGAARGIGAESARQLAARGAHLAVAGLEPDKLEALAAELGGPERAAPFECDVRDHDSVRAAVAGAVEHFGGIDVVVANAGIAPVGAVESIAESAFEATIDVNLLGVWRTVRAALPHVVERGGYVLPIASLAAAVHSPMMAHYAAAKAGVEAFGDALRGELADTAADVGVGYFGFIETDMVRNALAHPAAAGDQDARSRMGPLGRTHPVSDAGAAIVRGIERRARGVYWPRWIPAVLVARGVFQPFSEAFARRGDGLERLGKVKRLARENPHGTEGSDQPADAIPTPAAAGNGSDPRDGH